MPIKNLKLDDAELVELLRNDNIKCSQDYRCKRGVWCDNCAFKKICDAHDELFWVIDERDNKENSGD